MLPQLHSVGVILETQFEYGAAQGALERYEQWHVDHPQHVAPIRSLSGPDAMGNTPLTYFESQMVLRGMRLGISQHVEADQNCAEELTRLEAFCLGALISRKKRAERAAEIAELRHRSNWHSARAQNYQHMLRRLDICLESSIAIACTAQELNKHL